MRDNDMIPFVSVAANDIPYQTKIEIKQLKGLELPGTNGKKHNGCVVVHDESWSFDGQHIDFFQGLNSQSSSLSLRVIFTNNKTILNSSLNFHIKYYSK